MGLQSVVKLGLVAAAVAAAAPLASAAVIYDSGGFESPRFTANQPLAGQDVAVGPWLKDPGNVTANVSTVNAFSGSQSVEVKHTTGQTATRWAVLKSHVPSPGLNIVDIDADVRVQQAASNGSPFGPAFGLEAYDGPNLIGSLTIDAFTGDVLYQETGTGFLAAAGTTPTGVYHHLKLRVNFGSGTYQTYVDNVLRRTEAFVDAGAAGLTDAPITVFDTTGNNTAPSGTAYFDNYTITAIPEPTGALIGLALAGFAGRRRRVG